MATYNVERLTTAVVNLDTSTAFTAVAAADDFSWPGGADTVLLVVRNGHASTADTVTVDSTAIAADGLAQEDKTATVNAGEMIVIPISEAYRRAASETTNPNSVMVTHSSATDVDALVLYY